MVVKGEILAGPRLCYTDGMEEGIPVPEVVRQEIPLFDLTEPASISLLQDKLKASKGTAVVLIHPLFTYDHQLDPLPLRFQQYLVRLRQLIEKSQNSNIPIIILHQAISQNSPNDTDKLSLSTSLAKIGIVSNVPLFFIVTESSDPSPKRSRFDTQTSRAKTTKLINILQNAGLTKAIIGGESLHGGADPRRTDVFRPAGFPISGHPPNPNILPNYYLNRHPVRAENQRHPFQMITPEGCVASFIKSLAEFPNITIGVSGATSPETIPKTLQLAHRGGHYQISPIKELKQV